MMSESRSHVQVLGTKVCIGGGVKGWTDEGKEPQVPISELRVISGTVWAAKVQEESNTEARHKVGSGPDHKTLFLSPLYSPHTKELI